MFNLRITEAQFDWLIEHIDVAWHEKTVNLLKDHFVNGLSKSEVAAKYDISVQQAGQKVKAFILEVEKVEEEDGIRITTVIHQNSKSITSKLKKFDITNENTDDNFNKED